MTQRAVTFDLDTESTASLRVAFPEWEIDLINGATVAGLGKDWNPAVADLLVVQVSDAASETLGLCRSVRSQSGRAHTHLLVLVPAGREALVAALLEAGAHSCLILPIHAKDVASMLVHARAGNKPGRHTLNLERAQTEDRWRDDGGQG